MKYKFIYENHVGFRVGKMCRILEVSRSGYHKYVHRRVSQRRIENLRILVKIKQIYHRSKERYGSPRIYEELRKQGIICNKKRVVRLMRENGIRAKTKRKYKVTTDSKHNHPVAENLLEQNFQTSSPNKVWLSDITYIWTNEGWLYLACILDMCSRRVVGWHVDRTLGSSLVMTAFTEAIMQRGENPGLIFHSDRGVQYASYEIRNFIKGHDMIQSMSRKGNCYDNAVMESFFHTLKSELISFENFKTREEAKMKVFEYIEIFYNRQRIHSSIGYYSPVEYENKLIYHKVA